MQKIIFEALHAELGGLQPNDIYMTVLLRMFTTQPNRNGCAVTEAFIDNIVANAAKYTCLP